MNFLKQKTSKIHNNINFLSKFSIFSLVIENMYFHLYKVYDLKFYTFMMAKSKTERTYPFKLICYLYNWNVVVVFQLPKNDMHSQIDSQNVIMTSRLITNKKKYLIMENTSNMSTLWNNFLQISMKQICEYFKKTIYELEIVVILNNIASPFFLCLFII